MKKNDKNAVLLSIKTTREFPVNEPNANGHVYSKGLMKQLVEGMQERLPIYGIIYPAEDSFDLISNFSHATTAVWMENDLMVAEMDILDTPSGRIMADLINHKIRVSCGIRGAGSIVANVVQDDFELFSIDLIPEYDFTEKEGITMEKPDSITINPVMDHLTISPDDLFVFTAPDGTSPLEFSKIGEYLENRLSTRFGFKVNVLVTPAGSNCEIISKKEGNDAGN